MKMYNNFNDADLTFEEAIDTLRGIGDEEEPEQPKPVINTLNKDQFEAKIGPVFESLNEALSKSFGPYGSNTLISIYPEWYTTKDGFTIMKYLSFEDNVDRIISQMAQNICFRLNSAVGDGTTTAIVATNALYKSYMERKDFFIKKNVLPRTIVERFNIISEDVIKLLETKFAKPVNSEGIDKFKDYIRDIVFISSNGNEEITNIIVDLYDELQYPAIDVALASDGITKKKIINGYRFKTYLTDRIYINNDEMRRDEKNVDCLIFDHKVTENTFNAIILPLNEKCRALKRHLLIIAPFYDEIALQGFVKTMLNNEYRATKDINLILTVCRSMNAIDRQMMGDLAMLMNTTVLTTGVESDLLDGVAAGEPIDKLVNLNDRKEIPNILSIRRLSDNSINITKASEENNDIYSEVAEDGNLINNDYIVRLGYCENSNIGLEDSTFNGFYQDDFLYKKHLDDAKSDLSELKQRNQALGTFSIEEELRMRRLFNLEMKMGIIEVGGSTTLSQNFLKDTVVDAVKAAASAFNNGVVMGCNVDLIRAIINLADNENISELDSVLLDILKQGFMSVYYTVLSNAFIDDYVFNGLETTDEIINVLKDTLSLTTDNEFSEASLNLALTNSNKINDDINDQQTLFEVIIYNSIVRGLPFDLVTRTFNDKIINSTQTDREILKAVVDLLSLIISGNQMVITTNSRQ